MTHVYCIINPFAGGDEPVREYIDAIFNDGGITWHVHELQKGEKASTIVAAQLEKYDMIAVYGGDGSVTEAAAALIGTTTPLAIIPGGTANVLAKELGIPQDTETVLKRLRDQQFRLQTVDTGLVNGRPFLLRVSLGVMADMIIETNPTLKEITGQLAYGVAAIKTLHDAEPVEYTIEVDGITEKIKGVSLTVTNSGNAGIGDIQIYPGISMQDGLLDVLVLKDAGLVSVIKAAGGSLLQKETDVVYHKSGRKITITLPEEHMYLCDDCAGKASSLTLEVVPASLTIATPFAE